MSNPERAIVEVEQLNKSFGGTHALSSVSLSFLAGEVHAVCGENGAGKSTLNKILAGVHQHDSGRLLIDGAERKFASVREAESNGVALIHQELVAFPHLNAVDNIFVGDEMRGAVPWLVDRQAMQSKADSVLKELGQNLPLDVPIGDLSPAHQQMVAIARALVNDCKVLIMDEPTSSLSVRESEALFAVVRRLRASGVCVIYVSHRLGEILDLADRVSVLRDGELRCTYPIDEVDEKRLIELMVGREVNASGRSRGELGDPLLSVSQLSKEGQFNSVSFEVRAGEVVGLAGLVGAGRSEVARCLFGLEKPDSGTVLVNGQQLNLGDPQKAKQAGLAMVPEDRQGEGLVTEASVRENASLASMSEVFARGVWRRDKESSMSTAAVETLRVKADSIEQSVDSLSGGNQQKVLLGKWLATKPKVLILDEPTRGVDVGAKQEVHDLIRSLADEGVAVLLISSDMPEVLELSDRVLVMGAGEIRAEFEGDKATEDRVLAAAISGDAQDERELAAKPPWWHQREVSVAALLAVAILVASIVSPQFLSLGNIQDSLLRLAPIAIAACGLTFVVIAREIDISSGSLLGLCAAFIGLSVSTDHWAWHPLAAPVVAVGVGLTVGLVNGALVCWGRVPSIIVTLGMLTVLRGLTKTVMNDEWIQNIPDEARVWGMGSWLGIPVGIWMAVVIVGMSAVALRWTPFGRRLYAVGSSPRAARLVGVPINTTKMMAFGLAGGFVGLAALISATQVSVVEPGIGVGFELLVVTCVVVGGTSINGGRGTIIGTVLGVSLLGLVPTFMIFLKLQEVADYWDGAIQGLFILGAVLLDYRSRRRGRAE